LLDTGRLRNGFSGIVRGDGFAVATNVAYAAFHQSGASVRVGGRFTPRSATGRFASRASAQRRRAGAVGVAFTPASVAPGALPARPMVPDARGLPPKWERTFNTIAERIIARIMER
jgi:phage gpG-like protein